MLVAKYQRCVLLEIAAVTSELLLYQQPPLSPPLQNNGAAFSEVRAQNALPPFGRSSTLPQKYISSTATGFLSSRKISHQHRPKLLTTSGLLFVAASASQTVCYSCADCIQELFLTGSSLCIALCNTLLVSPCHSLVCMDFFHLSSPRPLPQILPSSPILRRCYRAQCAPGSAWSHFIIPLPSRSQPCPLQSLCGDDIF
jgi:hypothetical protein